MRKERDVMAMTQVSYRRCIIGHCGTLMSHGNEKYTKGAISADQLLGPLKIIQIIQNSSQTEIGCSTTSFVQIHFKNLYKTF